MICGFQADPSVPVLNLGARVCTDRPLPELNWPQLYVLDLFDLDERSEVCLAAEQVHIGRKYYRSFSQYDRRGVVEQS